MKFSSFLLIISSLIVGNYIDSLLVIAVNKPYFEISFLTMTFFYWCYSAPQYFSLTIIIICGVIIDFINANYLGANTLVFIIYSLVIKTYVFRLRLFSQVQVSLVFGLLSSLGFTYFYFILFPDGYQYTKLIFNFFTTIILWPFVFSACRYFRRNFAFELK